ncbi:sensor histidine kinase [Sulfurimonas sp.]|uniref:sensor histidine kinase n=1 Tax=Sulfurimonas sp. TaxID=2022749 RepID=UPI003567CF05
MFKSFIGKFIFFFWLFFFIVTVPIYYFSNYQFKEIIKKSEQEKITITLKTLKPIISIHIFLDQKKQLHELLNNMFEHDDIKSIKLLSKNGDELFNKSLDDICLNKLSEHKTTILDTISNTKVADLYIYYSNKHMQHFNDRIVIILATTFLSSLLVFLLVFFYIRYDLVALKNIANALKEYSKTKTTKKILQSSRSIEISTIANVANEMFINIAEYLKQLESFNIKLEKRVKEEIEKQQNQEKMMIHQSRQAAMGEMIESIAHQWRQPLNIIGLATVNLETQYALGQIDDKNFHEKMDVISKNINYMSDTIDDFRDFLNPKKTMSNFEATNSIEDVLGILDAQLKNYNIKYILNNGSKIHFKGVENEFKQVIIILLNNSKDAIKLQRKQQHDFEGRINIQITSQNNFGIIKICDNGGGIESDIIESIFNPYFSTKHNANGTGIGLYIAKNIIESRMKGNIWVKNTNDGCCFTISIPLNNES